MVVARVDGVATRDAAAALTHVGLFARRGQLPPPGEGEYYHDDLVGLQAQLADGAPFGRVIGVLNYGAGDILEIAAADGGETILLPFNEATAPSWISPRALSLSRRRWRSKANRARPQAKKKLLKQPLDL